MISYFCGLSILPMFFPKLEVSTIVSICIPNDKRSYGLRGKFVTEKHIDFRGKKRQETELIYKDKRGVDCVCHVEM